MELSLKPDFETVRQRYDAFWHQEIIDRAPVNLILPGSLDRPLPVKTYATHQERWLDIEFRAERLDIEMRSQVYLADALPVAWPNMGPEIFSAWCGCGYQYGETTTWSTPCVEDWQRDGDQAVFRADHPLFRKTIEFTRRLIDLGRGDYIVGLTDFHPGGDHLAALRDPQTLAIDLLDQPDAVKAKLATVNREYFSAYDTFYHLLREAGMPISSWIPLIHDQRYYIPSNDFSCMISNEMFCEFFLPGLIDECRFYDRSIYHLDGPGALRHLDTILDIPELDAVQWVCGAGNEGYHRWVNVYQKIQRKKKSLMLIDVTLDELPLIFETLRPEGVWFSGIRGIHDKETAQAVIRRIEQWR